MASIQTATGAIETDDLGFTLMHEHVLVMSWNYRMQYPAAFDRGAELALAVGRLEEAQAAGVKTIVDLTPIDLGRDAAYIRDAAERSGMQIVVATGFYYQHPFPGASAPSRPAALHDLMLRDITEGIGDTGVRAGVIKCATEPAVSEINEVVLRASAQVHRETGVPICTHTQPRNHTGLAQIEIFRDEGVDLGRVVIGHSDDAEDIEYLLELLDSGAYCGMDRIGLPAPRTSEQRADMVAALVERGYAERITLSHDSCALSAGVPHDLKAERLPDWRLTHIPQDIFPMLRERGVSEEQLTTMTVDNPRRIFEQTAAY
jgi:phosphotriesterase-related protein